MMCKASVEDQSSMKNNGNVKPPLIPSRRKKTPSVAEVQAANANEYTSLCLVQDSEWQ
jgi:hypothetical protein